MDLLPKLDPTYKRRPGTSGIGGQLYEIELLMLFLLKGVTKKENNELQNFYLATNMEEAGDFDDVVFKYNYNKNNIEKSKIIFLQAKHKESEKKFERELEKRKDKEKQITIDALLSKSENSDFVLRKYFSSYKKIKYLQEHRKHFIFKDGLASCSFIIFTNAVFDFSKNLGNVNKKYLNTANILSFNENSEKNYYFQLMDSQKVMDALRPSLDYEILTKELAKSICSGTIDGNKPIFKDYHITLAEKVIEKTNYKKGQLKDEFLDCEEDKEFRNGLLEEIQKNKPEKNRKTMEELKEEFRKKKIHLPNDYGIEEDNCIKLPLPSKLFEEKEVKEFINELKLFVTQPNESSLAEIIKSYIIEVYKLEQQDVDSVFVDVEYKIRKWWKDGNKYITENNRFFQESARVSITFNIREPITLFTGRMVELESLHEILQDGGEVVISQIASVTGLGGIGKTELARKYISEHSKDYDNNVIWITADNSVTIAESFRRLAKDKLRTSTLDENNKEKEIKFIVEDVYYFFAKRHRKSLFVFDNAGKYKAIREGEESEGIDQFLPSHSTKSLGHIKPTVLITSRDQEWGSVKCLQLGVFTEAEAIEFINKSLKNIIELQENDSKKLAEELQYFPLALSQAVAYIKMENEESKKWRETKFTVIEYIKLYSQKGNELLGKISDEFDHYTESVITTWNVTIDKIQEDIHGSQALEILNIVAYFAPDNIPVKNIILELLNIKYSERQGFFKAILNSILRLFVVLEEETLNFFKKNIKILQRAVELLYQYSMVNLEHGMLSVHRLVQQVTRLQLAKQGKEQMIIKNTFRVLGVTFPYGQDLADSHLERTTLLPHLEVFLSHINNLINKSPKNKENIEKDYLEYLLPWMGEGYSEVNPRRQKELLEWALEIYEKRYGPDSYDQVVTLFNLSNAYSRLGDPKQQKELLERVLMIDKKHYGPNYLEEDLLTNLGIAYGDLGDYQKQKQLLERALIITEKHNGLEHVEVAKLLTNLSSVYGTLGDTKNQKGLLERAFPILERHFGPEHEAVSVLLVNLAFVYGDLGDYQKAQQWTERALILTEKHYGREHVEVAKIMSNLASIYGNLGDTKNQKELLERALPILEKHYGSDHFDITKALVNLGNAFGDLGYPEKQKLLLKRVLKIQEKHYGKGHLRVAVPLINLATAYGDLGNHQKEKELNKTALEIQEKHYGAKHVKVAETLVNLSNACFALKESMQQKELLDRAIPILEEHYGRNHIRVAKALINLSSAYSGLGNYMKQMNLLLQALPIFEKYYESDHFEIAIIMENLGDAYGNLGFPRKRIEFTEKALKMKEKHYGSDSLKVAQIVNNLSIFYSSLGDYQKEKELLERALPIYEKYHHPAAGEIKESLEIVSRLLSPPSKGNLEMMQALVQEGVEIDESEVHAAVTGNSDVVLPYILDQIKENDPLELDETLNVQDLDGDTPLIWAVQRRKLSIAKILIKYGADLNIQNKHGETALHWATKYDCYECIQLLLDAQADPNVEDINGNTPLKLVQTKINQMPTKGHLKSIMDLFC